MGILSYIDTDDTCQRTLNHIRTPRLTSLVHFLLACRRDKVGREGKAAILRDFLEQPELTDSSIFFVDDNKQVIEEFDHYLEQVSTVHIKLKRKPSVHCSVPTAALMADASPVVAEWLRA